MESILFSQWQVVYLYKEIGIWKIKTGAQGAFTHSSLIFWSLSRERRKIEVCDVYEEVVNDWLVVVRLVGGGCVTGLDQVQGLVLLDGEASGAEALEKLTKHEAGE